MKLYATTTSERASKGQGGNKFLMIEIGDGERKKLAEANIRVKENGLHIYFTTLLGKNDQSVDYFMPFQKGNIWDEMDKDFPKGFIQEKGEKQKGEVIPCECGYPDNKDNHMCKPHN